MPRSTNSPASRRRRKRVIKSARGYFGRKSKLFRYAKEAVDHAGQHAYRDRRRKKRTWRSLWIVRINAACRAHDITYSRFMEGLAATEIALDRKIIADLAVRDEEAFGGLVEKARDALKQKVSA